MPPLLPYFHADEISGADSSYGRAAQVCYLRVDYRVVSCVQRRHCPPPADGEDLAKECTCQNTPAQTRIEAYSLGVIFIYAGVIPMIFFSLLLSQRHVLKAEQSNIITRTLSMLHSPYHTNVIWPFSSFGGMWPFEFVEMYRKLFLVGFAVFIKPGSLLQLVVAILFALVVLSMQMHFRPFKSILAAYLAMLSQVSTIVVLLICIVLRAESIVEVLHQYDIQRTLWDFLDFDSATLMSTLFASSVSVLGFVGLFTLHQVFAMQLLPQFVYRTHSPPLVINGQNVGNKHARLKSVTGDSKKTHHAFISHVWATGQDAARSIKQLLKEVLPGIKVFLDVDDLTDINALEGVVQSTHVVMIFVSAGYFTSTNCLRELISALFLDERRVRIARHGQKQAPHHESCIRLVLESPDKKGALTNEQLCLELDKSEKMAFVQAKEQVEKWAAASFTAAEDLPLLQWFRDKFNVKWVKWKFGRGRHLWKSAVPWHRVAAYQQLTLLELAESVVERPMIHDVPVTGHFLDCPKGPLDEKILLKAPPDDGFHCYVSPYNAGAVEFAHDELRPKFDPKTPLAISYSPKQLWDHIYNLEQERSVATPRTPRRSSFVGRHSTGQGGFVGDDQMTAAAYRNKEAYPGATVFLLYLDGRTWESSRSAQLEAEVKAALMDKMPILLVHEEANDFHRFRRDFAHFFRVTPRSLLDLGIYRPIATALHAGEYRKQSLHEAAKALIKLLSEQYGTRHETGRHELPHVEWVDESEDDPFFCGGAVLDLHRMRALEDKTRMHDGEPEMTISPALVAAAKAASAAVKGVSRQATGLRGGALRRSAWGKLGAPVKVDTRVDKAVLADVDEPEVDASSKDWLGEKLAKLEVLLDHRGPIIEGPRYLRKDLESQPCALWREVPLQTVDELTKVRHKWVRKQTMSDSTSVAEAVSKDHFSESFSRGSEILDGMGADDADGEGHDHGAAEGQEKIRRGFKAALGFLRSGKEHPTFTSSGARQRKIQFAGDTACPDSTHGNAEGSRRGSLSARGPGTESKPLGGSPPAARAADPAARHSCNCDTAEAVRGCRWGVDTTSSGAADSPPRRPSMLRRSKSSVGFSVATTNQPTNALEA